MDVVRALMEKAIACGKLEDMCNTKDASGKTPFDMAAAGQHKVTFVSEYHKGFDLTWFRESVLTNPGYLNGFLGRKFREYTLFHHTLT